VANVRVNIDERVPQMVRDFVEANEEAVAKEIEENAKASSEFADKTGILRKRIKAKKSRYELGGWIVEARAPHAHLIEYGHELIDWRTNKRIGTVPPRSFLRTAKERAIASAMSKFGVR